MRRSLSQQNPPTDAEARIY